jgi:hypothetical protein
LLTPLKPPDGMSLSLRKRLCKMSSLDRGELNLIYEFLRWLASSSVVGYFKIHSFNRHRGFNWKSIRRIKCLFQSNFFRIKLCAQE